MKNLYDYMIARYGNANKEPNLYQLIQELESFKMDYDPNH